MTEEQENNKPEPKNKPEEQENNKPEPEENNKPSPIEEAKLLVKQLEEQNKLFQENLKQNEIIMQNNILGGVTNTGKPPATEKEESINKAKTFLEKTGMLNRCNI